MLVVSRRDDESIEIKPSDDTDTSMTLEELFSTGSIEIRVFSSNGSRVKMGVQAPEQLTIWRKGTAA